MTIKDKKYLVDLLAESHATIRATVAEIDPKKLIYTGTGMDWQVRDILGHLATSDREATKALHAYQASTEYVIPNYVENEDDINQQAALEQSALTIQKLFAEWENARKELISAVKDIPNEHFPGDMRYPWGGQRCTFAFLVEEMVRHDIEHKNDILQAIEENGKGSDLGRIIAGD